MIVELPPADSQMISAKAVQYGMSEAQLIAIAVASYEPEVFDMDEIQRSIESGFVAVPKSLANDKQAFVEWLKRGQHGS